MIYTFIFIEVDGGVQIKPLRGSPRIGAHSLVMTLIRFFGKKNIKAKTFIQQRKSYYVELLCGISMAREASVCPLTFW